jgi:hypothetical protein
MKAQHTLIRFAVIAVSALAAVPATASAGIWTPVATGTTGDITAVDYVAAGSIVYGTAAGQLMKGGVVKDATNLGLTVNDIAFNPSGSVGLAALNGGKLMRTVNGGESWSPVSLANATRTSANPCTGGATALGTPTRNLTAISWGDNSTAYIVGDDEGMVLKSTNNGTSFTDVSRQVDGTCRVGASGRVLHDVEAISANVVYVLSNYFGERYFSADGIATTAVHQDQTSANCYQESARFAIDHNSPNRQWVVDACSSNLGAGFSSDSGTSWDISIDYPNGDPYSLSGLNDISAAGGSALAVGNGGAIIVNLDGPTAYFQRADGADATSSWLAASKLDAGNAVVAGRNGRMVISTSANAIPDVVAPAGTLTGPTTVAAGTPATYTANVADNAGGSGIDPASFVWTATGVPTATGNPATLTFPSAGYYNVTVSFKDLAGNAGAASLSVIVNTPVPVKAPPPTKTTTASVPGAKISFGVPNTCVKAGSTFKVTLTWKKQRRKGNKFVKVRRADFYIGSKRVKIDKKAPFTQTLKVKAGTKAGSTITVKARAFVKVTKGKSPTKSISSKIKVCS